jgi:GT2 family glycosyltransferase
MNFPQIPTTSQPHPDFSCFLIHKRVTDKVGWFDEEYTPAFCEDCDYHVRMHRAGIRAVCLDLPFLHHGSMTVKNAESGEQARIKRGADQNRERFRQKYGCLPGTKEYEALFA